MLKNAIIINKIKNDQWWVEIDNEERNTRKIIMIINLIKNYIKIK